MDSSQELVCPCCGKAFTLSNACWHLCHECLRIFAPGEGDDRDAHKVDGRCVRRLGTGLRCYSREDAERKRQRFIERRWEVTDT